MRHVTIVERQGPLYAAFTTKDLAVHVRLVAVATGATSLRTGHVVRALSTTQTFLRTTIPHWASYSLIAGAYWMVPTAPRGVEHPGG